MPTIFNASDRVRVMHRVPVKAGDILRVAGVQGNHMLTEPASPGQCEGKLWVAQHDAPGLSEVAHSADAVGFVLPWMVYNKGVDTREAQIGDPVFLDLNGKRTLQRGVGCRKVGHVVAVGFPSVHENGEPGCGAILLAPNDQQG